MYSITEDSAGNLWIAKKELGLALAVDLVRRGLWIGFYRGGIAYFDDGQIRARIQPPAGGARAV
jgi:hypothetical protein